MYVIAKTLEEAKNVARRENKNMPKSWKRINSVSISSGRLHRKHKEYNEYVFDNRRITKEKF